MSSSSSTTIIITDEKSEFPHIQNLDLSDQFKQQQSKLIDDFFVHYNKSFSNIYEYIGNKDEVISLEKYFGTLKNADYDVQFEILDEISKKIAEKKNTELNDQVKIFVESYKLFIMEETLAEIYAIDERNKQSEEEKKNYWSNKFFSKLFLYSLLFSAFLDGVNGMAQVITDIGSASNLVTGIFCFIGGAITTLMVRALEGKSLEQAMGVSSKAKADTLVNLSLRQCNVMKKINCSLTEPHNQALDGHFTPSQYAKYVKFAKRFNHHLGEKKNRVEQYKESFIKRAARAIAVFAGGVMYGFNIYFSVSSGIATAVGLSSVFGALTGGIGLGIAIGVAALVGISYMVIQSKKLAHDKPFEQLQKKLEIFDREKSNNELIYAQTSFEHNRELRDIKWRPIHNQIKNFSKEELRIADKKSELKRKDKIEEKKDEKEIKIELKQNGDKLNIENQILKNEIKEEKQKNINLTQEIKVIEHTLKQEEKKNHELQQNGNRLEEEKRALGVALRTEREKHTQLKQKIIVDRLLSRPITKKTKQEVIGFHAPKKITVRHNGMFTPKVRPDLNLKKSGSVIKKSLLYQ